MSRPSCSKQRASLLAAALAGFAAVALTGCDKKDTVRMANGSPVSVSILPEVIYATESPSQAEVTVNIGTPYAPGEISIQYIDTGSGAGDCWKGALHGPPLRLRIDRMGNARFMLYANSEHAGNDCSLKVMVISGAHEPKVSNALTVKRAKTARSP